MNAEQKLDYIDENEYMYKNLDIEIDLDFMTSSNLSTDEIKTLANKVADYYLENKEQILEYIYNDFKKTGWFVDDYSKDEIFAKIGNPKINMIDEKNYNITYLESSLDDEHIIEVELFLNDENKYILSYVSVDG